MPSCRLDQGYDTALVMPGAPLSHVVHDVEGMTEGFTENDIVVIAAQCIAACQVRSLAPVASTPVSPFPTESTYYRTPPAHFSPVSFISTTCQ
ncbi:hypothetical protein J6590_058712 [Homalodisca vitripennis]|nr:hypothetical protein J6590_058712 [Homalodisca vitripennis]